MYAVVTGLLLSQQGTWLFLSMISISYITPSVSYKLQEKLLL